MSYQNDLTQNNTDLQAILATVNALPEAGGGGGGAVETCTVEIVAEVPAMSTNLTYLDAGGSFTQKSVSEMDFMMGVTIICPINSIIHSSQGIFTDIGDRSTGEVYKADGLHFIVAKGDGRYVIN